MSSAPLELNAINVDAQSTTLFAQLYANMNVNKNQFEFGWNNKREFILPFVVSYPPLPPPPLTWISFDFILSSTMSICRLHLQWK